MDSTARQASASVSEQYRTILAGLQGGSRNVSKSSKSLDETSTSARRENSKQIETKVPKLQQLVDLPDPDGLGTMITVPLGSYYGQEKRTADQSREWDKCAIIVRRVVEDNMITQFQIEIQSKLLQVFLSNFVAPFTDVMVVNDVMIVPNPFRCLFHRREAIESDMNSKEQEDPLRKEIKLLYDFVRSEDALKYVIQQHESLLAQNRITCDILWTLYPPQDVVYSRTGQVERCYRVEDAYLDVVQGRYVVVISVLYSYHNGQTSGICRQRMVMPWFTGTVALDPSELPLVPLRCMPEGKRKEIEERLKKRGREFEKRQTNPPKKSFLQIIETGSFWGSVKDDDFQILDDGDSYSVSTNSRVIVDPIAARSDREMPHIKFIASNWQEYIKTKGQQQENIEMDQSAALQGREPPKKYDDALKVLISPKATTGSRKKRSSRRQRSSFNRRSTFGMDLDSSDDPDGEVGPTVDLECKPGGQGQRTTNNSNLTDDDYLLFPHKIDAFLLDKKTWVQVLVTDLEEVDYYPNPYEAVQLPHEKKHLIGALVDGFSRGIDGFEFDDIVPGKGRGLFFLLHGETGLGKTFTAEAIAEQTRKPLYRVSTADLGSDIEKMETSLKRVFKFGWRWGAVVLIDEADVLVAKRSEKELERNAIVAMFLNLVEYYKGLLFVTTNREYTFDEAFKNRMHAIVRFPELGYNSRLNIWRNFLFNSRRPIPLDESLSKDETEIQILAKLKCNGRDIRNLIRTAFSYASSYNQKLGVRHIAVVMKELSQEKNVEELLKDLAPAIKRVRTGLIDDQDPTMPKDSNAGGSKV